MNPAGSRRIFIIVSIVSLSISYLGIWIRFINDPVERTGSDFIAFYSAGRVAQSAGLESVYNPLLQQKIQEEQVRFPLAPGQVLLYNHLPFLIPILQVIASDNYTNSFYRWVLLLVVLYITGIAILNRGLRQAGVDQNSILLASVGGLLFLPLFFSLMNGQDTAFLFLGTAIWLYGLISGKETLAGLGLSLTTVRPHIAILLGLPMFFQYKKVFLGFIAGSGILAVFSIMLLGMEGTWKFIDILFVSAGGNWYGMKENAMYNLIGMMTRAFPWLDMGIIRTAGWIFYGIAIISLCILWARNKTLSEGQIGVTIILALFIVPHLHFHDLALLLIPIFEIIRSSMQGGRLKTSIVIMLPPSISLLFLASNTLPILQYTIPYIIMLALASYTYFSKIIYNTASTMIARKMNTK